MLVGVASPDGVGWSIRMVIPPKPSIRSRRAMSYVWTVQPKTGRSKRSFQIERVECGAPRANVTLDADRNHPEQAGKRRLSLRRLAAHAPR
jgi:hypothetical protein